MFARIAAAVLIASWSLAGGSEMKRLLAGPSEPVIDTGFVGNPEFDLRSGKLSAGTAFFASAEGESDPLLITAQHIFGSAGGLTMEVPREQMAAFTKRVTVNDLVKGRTYTTRIEAVAIPGIVDVAVFRTAAGAKIKAHPLARANPKKGDVIWLVACLRGQPAKQILHRGIVAEVWDGNMKCQFDEVNLVTNGGSGAPYVNALGEIVGVHVGSFRDPKSIAGAVIPVETIVEAIRAAGQAAADAKTAARK